MAETNQTGSEKIFKTRDSATTVLRKLGLKPRDYDLFIAKIGGNFVCQVGAAISYLASLSQAKPIPAKETRLDSKESKTTKRTGVSQMARDLILAGKTNDQVWVILRSQFNLDDSKKHYPAWYRSELRRKGELAK